MPRRIQRKRPKGWRMPEGAVYVGRPTKWGNPYKPQDFPDIESCLEEYAWHLSKSKLDTTELRGKDLACFCPLGQPCHADILLELANEQ